MVDTSKIHALIAQARRRLRLQAALESATTASILAFAAGLVIVYAMRQGALATMAGVLLLIGCVALIAAGALLGALGRFPTHLVAARIDRASNLADRLTSACAFEGRVSGKEAETEDSETRAFMLAAIRDAVAAAPRANVAAATPFGRPRDGRAALAVGLVAALVAGLYWPQGSLAGPAISPDAARLGQPAKPEPRDVFAEEDLDYARDLLEDLRRVARTEREPTLDEFVKDVENLLAKAELGELTKEELLDQLTRAEQRFMEGAEEHEVEKALDDLRETGRELAKNSLTKEIGKALEQGDLEKAKAEMEKLAEKLDKGELSEKQKTEVAKALDKAAEKFEKKAGEREEKLDKQIADKEEQVRKLEQKRDEAKNEQEKQRLSRQLDKRQRELKQLQREKEEQERSAEQRTLKQLHRNLKQAAQEMQQKDQQNQRQASQSLRRASQDTGKVDADQRKVSAQKKVASQLSDLEEAMRRAQRGGKSGMQDLFGKNSRNQDFRRRARGQGGSQGAWRPGQKGQGQNGQSQAGKQPGGSGKQPGGTSYGDEHDPNLMGDATPKSGKTRDESVSGVHGRGPSVRETILSAAQKGFASRTYQKVFADYKANVEEVMRAEKVPSGYKYYVKRYFQKIKPHSMD